MIRSGKWFSFYVMILLPVSTGAMGNKSMYEYQSVLYFWFKELTPEQWFTKDLDLDEQILSRFGELHKQAIDGELSHWRDEPEGRLAEIIILDQFSRNMFRGDVQSFAYDGIALVLAQEAVRAGAMDYLTEAQQNFLLMPYMHSESSEIHK